MSAIGRRRWVIPGGHLPLDSTGHEPEWTSHDLLCVLNAGDAEAKLALTVYYANRDPVGPFELTVAAERVRHVRFNDLIDPEPIPLDVPYGCVIVSSRPVVVQFVRRETARAENAILSAMAFADD